MVQEGSEVGEVDDVDDVHNQQAEGPSAPYGVDSWYNQRVGEGTELDGVGLVREVVERYRETGQARVVTDTREVEEGTHSKDFHVEEEGASQTGSVSAAFPLGRKKNGSRKERGNTTHVGRRSGRDAHLLWTGTGALLRRVGLAGWGRHLGRQG
jgi:hypothetical protein